MIMVINGAAINMSPSTSQRVEFIYAYENMVWVKSCGTGEHHLIPASKIQAVELGNDIELRVNNG